MNYFNYIPPIFSGKKNRKPAFFCLLTAFLFFISSCSNNHCTDPMYAPLVVSFYSEIDTSVQISPRFLVIEGIGSNDLMNVSGHNSVNLFLKKFEESTNFSFTFAHDESKIDTFIFVEKINSSISPCGSSNGDSISIYRKDNNLFCLCSQSNNALIVYGEGPEILFLQSTAPDTLFLFEPTRDVLSIKHTNTQTFVSAECGCLTTFKLDEVRHTNNNIRDVLITDSSVTSAYNEKHIRIYIENY